jgi:ferredoxin-type protein NapG
MACCRLCPTDALDSRLVEPERVRMGKARIDASICYSILFLEQDTVQDASAVKIPALCNTCYNVCPFPDKAILLKGNLYPVVTDACVGCGICVERCPTRPRRAINIVPAGMGRTDEAGFHYQRGRKFRDQADVPRPPQEGRVWSGQDLLDQKKRIPPTDDKVQPRFPSTTDKFQRDLE